WRAGGSSRLCRRASRCKARTGRGLALVELIGCHIIGIEAGPDLRLDHEIGVKANEEHDDGANGEAKDPAAMGVPAPKRRKRCQNPAENAGKEVADCSEQIRLLRR